MLQVPEAIQREIAAVFLADPLINDEDVAKKLNLSTKTVRKYKRQCGKSFMEELEQRMLNRIQLTDLEILDEGSDLIKNIIRAKANAKELSKENLASIASALDSSFKRRQLMTGGATENTAIAAVTYLPEQSDEE